MGTYGGSDKEWLTMIFRAIWLKHNWTQMNLQLDGRVEKFAKSIVSMRAGTWV
jgi:hypothetical protein